MRKFLVILLLVGGSSITMTSNVNAANFALDRTITNTENGFYRDVEWLDGNFDARDDRTWLVLADIYMKCKWLEKFIFDNSPITFCFSTNQTSSQMRWLNFIYENKKFFVDHNAGNYVAGENLKRTVWSK